MFPKAKNNNSLMVRSIKGNKPKPPQLPVYTYNQAVALAKSVYVLAFCHFWRHNEEKYVNTKITTWQTPKSYRNNYVDWLICVLTVWISHLGVKVNLIIFITTVHLYKNHIFRPNTTLLNKWSNQEYTGMRMNLSESWPSG